MKNRMPLAFRLRVASILSVALAFSIPAASASQKPPRRPPPWKEPKESKNAERRAETERLLRASVERKLSERARAEVGSSWGVRLGEPAVDIATVRREGSSKWLREAAEIRLERETETEADKAEISRLSDAMLVEVFGSSRNVGEIPRKNMEKLVKLLRDAGYHKGSLEKWEEVAKSKDLHSPIELKDVKPKDVVRQHRLSTDPMTSAGEYIIVEKGWHLSELGLGGMSLRERKKQFERVGRDEEPQGRVERDFIIKERKDVQAFEKRKEDPQMLKSRVASTIDYWSPDRFMQSTSRIEPEPPRGPRRVIWKDGVQQLSAYGVFTSGGAPQGFLPNARDLLQPLPKPAVEPPRTSKKRKDK